MQTTTPTATPTTTGATQPPLAAPPELVALLDAAIDDAIGQFVLSQGRCVDHLLDLYNSTEHAAVRSAVSFVLDGIRRLTAVRADEFVDNLRLIAAVAEVEGAFSVAA
jgi:hypothetical protein